MLLSLVCVFLRSRSFFLILYFAFYILFCMRDVCWLSLSFVSVFSAVSFKFDSLFIFYYYCSQMLLDYIWTVESKHWIFLNFRYVADISLLMGRVPSDCRDISSSTDYFYYFYWVLNESFKIASTFSSNSAYFWAKVA